MFDEFYKTDESHPNLNSNGLGLLFVKTIVEKLDGTNWIESDGPGKGSTFYFTLPKKENDL
ncbi:MAG: ATP-binding protein [Candidatus Thermoplasmatota archaeon]|nr:ATP-binding protein [Candidatus Thermoplasmatota archaeon]